MTSEKQHKYNNPFTATLTGIRDLFRKQIPDGALLESDRFDGKTVFVDGSSSGLGFAIAIEAAKRGANLIMACRSGIPEKGEQVKLKSGNQNIQMIHVDYTDTRSIFSMVKTLKTRFPSLDVVICNAGIVPKESRKTPQQLEEMFMVNYFSKFILIRMLIEEGCITGLTKDNLNTKNRIPEVEYQAKTAEKPRIIFVASESHRNPDSFNWPEFGLYQDYKIGKSIELYGYYKLLLTTFSAELSRRLNTNGNCTASVLSLCPGPVNSNIAREAPKVFHPILKLVFGIFFRSPAKAAIPAVYMAASKDFSGNPFDYFFLMSRKKIDEKASDPGNGKRLWELSEALQNKIKQISNQ